MICDSMARNKSIANEFELLPSLQRFLLELPDDIDRIEALLNLSVNIYTDVKQIFNCTLVVHQ